MQDAIVITGMGLMTPLGADLDTFWNALLSGQTAVRAWEDLEQEGFRQSAACRIAALECDPLERGRRMTDHCVRQALTMAKTDPPENTGVFIGSTMGESAAFEIAARTSRFDLSDYTCEALNGHVAERYGLSGPAIAFGTACAAGNYALNAAATALRNSETDLAIAGGVDPFSRIAMAGFSRSRAMSADGKCRPFDQRRNGMVLGEGAAFFVLERASDALVRGALPLARIGAMGITCDAYHATAPEPSGKWIEACIRQALRLENITEKDVSWVCAHGSGTVPSDQTEAIVLNRIFNNTSTSVSAFKGATGHTLGAATAIEAVVCVLSLIHQMIPPTTGCEDPIDHLSFKINQSPKEAEITYVLNNGYAFGGLNTALILGKWN